MTQQHPPVSAEAPTTLPQIGEALSAAAIAAVAADALEDRGPYTYDLVTVFLPLHTTQDTLELIHHYSGIVLSPCIRWGKPQWYYAGLPLRGCGSRRRAMAIRSIR